MRELTEILLVEDDPRDAKQIVRELNVASPKHVINVVRDGEEALDFLFNRGAFAGRSAVAPPGLVLLDLNLPKVNGLEVLKEVRASDRTRAIPVIILTSSREDRDLLDSYRIGINSYIQKPLGFEEFRDTIRALGLYWLQINQPPPKEILGSGAA
jgi:DNA-binding response OmpR family regulator